MKNTGIQQIITLLAVFVLLAAFSACETTSEDRVITEKYESGNPKSEIRIKNNELDGEWKIWYESGALKAEGGYSAGKKSGRWRRYYENGNVEAEGQYSDGLQHDEWTLWYPGGKLKATGFYEYGKMSGEWTAYRQDGTTVIAQYKDGKKDGKWIERFPDGQKKAEGEYQQGRKVNKWTEWNAEGKVIFETTYPPREIIVEDPVVELDKKSPVEVVLEKYLAMPDKFQRLINAYYRPDPNPENEAKVKTKLIDYFKEIFTYPKLTELINWVKKGSISKGSFTKYTNVQYVLTDKKIVTEKENKIIFELNVSATERFRTSGIKNARSFVKDYKLKHYTQEQFETIVEEFASFDLYRKEMRRVYFERINEQWMINNTDEIILESTLQNIIGK
jgi:antitoxin component YwqK of YwqJK toxin-antitoxin module